MEHRASLDGRIVVSICGASGVGKSQLAKAVAEALGEDVAVRVPTDYFLAPATEPLEAYFAKPLRYDWPLLARVITLPDGTPTSTPDFDFETFQRVAETGGRPFVLRGVALIDAMYPYPDADATILLTAPDAVRRTRIAERDTVWRTNVAARWENLELSRSYLQSLNIRYDLELSGVDNLDRTAKRVATWLREMYADVVGR